MKRNAVIILVCLSTICSAQMVITNGDPDTLVNNYLSGCGISIMNITYVGQTGSTGAGQIGHFMNGNVTNLGMNEGIALSSGDVSILSGPASGFASADMSGSGDNDLTVIAGASTYDACVLEFDFIPAGDTISIRYIFGSEEYLEYVGSGYNDIFALFITGTNPQGGNYISYNIARVPGQSVPVSIDNINDVSYSQYYVNNEALGGTTIVLDGFTVPLIARANVIAGMTYHLKIAVADAGDHSFDSAVFLEAYSFSTGGTGQGSPHITTYQSGLACTGLPGVTGWVSVTGGTPPYIYEWSSGQTDTVAYNISAGTYYITVTDSTGCDVGSLVVPGASFAFETVAFPPACNASDGVIMANVTVGLTEPYIFLWSNGQQDTTTNPSTLAYGLTAGTYTVTVINGIGCSATDTIALSSLSSAQIITDTLINPTCAGNDGELYVFVDNPVVYPYTFNLTGFPAQVSNDSASWTGLLPGHYFLNVSDSNNCISVTEFDMASPPLPYAMFTYSINQKTVTYTNQSAAGTYFWDFGDSGGSTDVNPVHTYQAFGFYLVCLWQFGPCGSIEYCDTINIVQVSFPGEYPEKIKVYPNPAYDNVFIELPGAVKNETITINDITGKVVLVQQLTSGKNSIDISSLPQGIYYMILNGDTNGWQKVVVIK